MIEIRWHGRGGQGSFTVAKLFGIAAAEFGGKFSTAFPSFGPERRGAPVLGFNRISDEKITDRSEVEVCDYVVVLDETLWGPAVIKGLKPEGKIIINTDKPEVYQNQVKQKIVGLDGTKMALETLGLPITNTALMGALIAVSGVLEVDACEQAILNNMKPKIAAKNIELFRRAYEKAKGAAANE